MRLEARNLLLRPGMDARAAAAIAFDADGWIVRDHADIDGVVQKHTQNLQQIVGGLRRLRLSADDVFDVSAFEAGNRLIPMLVAETLDNVVAHGLRAGREVAELR
jgi:hypothetical protein